MPSAIDDVHAATDVPTKHGINGVSTPVMQNGNSKRPPKILELGEYGMGSYANDVPVLSPEEEDAVLRDATGGFTGWIANFIRRVILLFDNLPEESGGSTEGTNASVVWSHHAEHFGQSKWLIW